MGEIMGPKLNFNDFSNVFWITGKNEGKSLVASFLQELDLKFSRSKIIAQTLYNIVLCTDKKDEPISDHAMLSFEFYNYYYYRNHCPSSHD